MKNVIKPLAKSVLTPLRLIVAASWADAGIHKKILGSGHNNINITLIISNDKINDIIEIIKFIEGSGLLLKGDSKTVQNKVKEQKGGFLSMLLGTLGANLLENILTGQGINRAGEGAMATRQDRGIVRGGYGNKKGKKNNGFLMPPHPLTNFEIQEYCMNIQAYQVYEYTRVSKWA